MSAWARIKNVFGGRPEDVTLAAATTVAVPDHAGWVELTGTATITSLTATASTRGRIVFFHQSDSGTTTFTNSNNPTTVGEMDMGGSNLALAQSDVVALRLKKDGTWVRTFATDN